MAEATLFERFKEELPAEVRDKFDDYQSLPDAAFQRLLKGVLGQEETLREIGIEEELMKGVKAAIAAVLQPAQASANPPMPVSQRPEVSGEVDIQNDPQLKLIYDKLCKALPAQLHTVVFFLNIGAKVPNPGSARPVDVINGLIREMVNAHGREEAIKVITNTMRKPSVNL